MLGKIKDLYREQPDTEHGQNFVRIVSNSAIIIYLLILSAVQDPPIDVRFGIIISSPLIIYSIVLLIYIAKKPGISKYRRFTSMFLDYFVITAHMVYYGEPMAVLFMIYVWVTIGYGLRYGRLYLASATLLSTIGFIIIMTTSTYWINNQGVGVGFLIGMLVIPIYTASLLKQVTEATNEAKKANMAKGEFLAMMSHEIRTPMSSVISMSDIIINTARVDEKNQYAALIKENTENLLLLIDDILDYKRIEDGKLICTEDDFSVDELMDSTIALLSEQAKRKQITVNKYISPEVPDYLFGQSNYIRHVIINLLSNAVKFTDEGSIDIIVNSHNSIDRRLDLIININDTGIGIAAEALPFIFEHFQQADSSITRKYGGTGLGSAIAKMLVEYLGGSISVESEINVGTKFTVTLPLLISDSNQAAQKNDANIDAIARKITNTQKKIRILVVEDDLINKTVILHLLKEYGSHSTYAENGRVALEKLETDDIDLVIIDFHMPELSGIDVIKHVRGSDKPYKNIPFILLTADITERVVKESLNAGANAYITKPVLYNTLIKTIEKCIE